ncbi:MAG TPA: hypothetical protein VFY71_03455, partial [Planctomycetota bacterium]|nr:hypothetical protein [Planctomycetota bacterium]
MRTLAATCLLMLFPVAAAQAQTLVGPLPYLSSADSPFDLAGNFQLEDFEDGVLDVTGVTSSDASIVNPSGITDSVDADDGLIDGSGTGGHTWFTLNGSGGITFTFSAAAPGGLPTQAGIVWTDGGVKSDVTFLAFDGNGASLGTLFLPQYGDGSPSGATAE